MEKKKNVIKKAIFLSELFDTQAFVVPIKTTFYLSFFANVSDISLYKFLTVFVTFLCEIPLGYFSDKYGNRITVLLSYFTSILALFLMVLNPCNNIFIISNILFGLSNALVSGAKNTYLIKVSEVYNFSYREIKLKASGQKKIVELLMMTLSGFLFSINIFYPFVINITIYLFVLTLIVLLPKVRVENNEVSLSMMSKLLMKKIISDKKLLNEIIFYSITTTMLIINFDYYNVIFMRNQINKGLYGLIYSCFMLINYLGIKLFNKAQKTNRIQYIVFLLLPLTFFMIITNNLYIVAIAIILQQIAYAFIFIRFDIYLIDYVKNITQGTHFQSLISFWYSIFKSIILFCISFSLKYMDLYCLYVFIAIILIISIYLYRGKNEV